MNVYQQAFILSSSGLGNSNFDTYQKILATSAIDVYMYIYTLNKSIQDSVKQKQEDEALKELDG